MPVIVLTSLLAHRIEATIAPKMKLSESDGLQMPFYDVLWLPARPELQLDDDFHPAAIAHTTGAAPRPPWHVADVSLAEPQPLLRDLQALVGQTAAQSAQQYLQSYL